jgi:hypothetical protein
MNPNIQREKLIYRYMRALERGDLDTIDEIFALAERDETLETMITEVHRAMITEEDRAIIKELAEDFSVILRSLCMSPSTQKTELS